MNESGQNIACIIKRFIVSFVEYGDNVDGKARILGAYCSDAEARRNMHLAADQYKKDLLLDEIEKYDDSASVGDYECGCEYRIDEIPIVVYYEDVEKVNVERNEDGDSVLHAYVEIPKGVIRKWNDMMRKDRLDYDKLGFKPHENVAKWTATFPDGCFADIKVNTGEIDHELYCEAVLFDALGSQVAFSHEASYELDSPDWILWDGKRSYRIHVVGRADK